MGKKGQQNRQKAFGPRAGGEGDSNVTRGLAEGREIGKAARPMSRGFELGDGREWKWIEPLPPVGESKTLRSNSGWGGGLVLTRE